MELRQVVVELTDRPYTIHIGAGALGRIGELAPPSREGQTAAVIADDRTVALFAERVLASLRRAGWRCRQFTVPAGEASKTLSVAGDLWGALADEGLDRRSVVFALGGGVIGDLAGFVAATYMRGIDFVTVPTTLLAQVDSSVGGKVGVDLPQAKNLVGAFHQPRMVVIDPDTLTSLPHRHYQAGLGEVVKHAAIADAALFETLGQEADRVTAREPALLTDVIARNCEIKASVVSRDPEERTGLRAVLNYGHTIGHAIERGVHGWGLLHGEAVAVGMLAEARLAARLGLSGPEVAARLEELLTALSACTSVPAAEIDAESAVRALRADKKIASGKLWLPVVPVVGSVTVTETVPVEELIHEVEALTQ